MKEQIKILLIGDTGTGKSSVISSYISKYFPDEVPSVLVDAIIPPDKCDNVSVTIMDSSSLLGDREVLHQKIRMADSIISLFDVTKPQTIDSLEELWLPTIRDICGSTVNKAVIVVGNKTDLISDLDEPAQLEAEKYRMNKILKDFPFVVACYRCSAKLIEVDQMFYESELAVTFPVGPLFDTTRSEFTSQCKIAFSRIFRCFDSNQDGLLSDEELNYLQQQSFGVPLKDEEVTALKQEICKSVPGGMRNESITFKGLMGIMRLFIYRGQQQTPWTMLARFGYEDRSFTLEIPAEIEEEQETCEEETFELSPSAYNFLQKLAVNASIRRVNDEESESIHPRKNVPVGQAGGNITWGDLGDILNVMPAVSHPWSYPPICQDDYDQSVHIFLLSGSSAPPLLTPSMINSVSDSGMFSSWLQPNMDFHDDQSTCDSRANFNSNSDCNFCSVDAWLSQWQMLAVHRPVLVQTLLYRMGYVEREDLGLNIVSRPECVRPTDKRVINVCLLGGVGVGKADLVRAMSSLAAQTLTQTTSTVVTFGDASKTGNTGNVGNSGNIGNIGNNRNNSNNGNGSGSDNGGKGSAGGGSDGGEGEEYPGMGTGSGISGSGFFYAEAEVADIESEGYPLHVLKVGYDCDVEEERIEATSGTESLYVHGSCHITGTRLCYVFTAVPYDRAVDWIESHAISCDVAVLVLDCGENLIDKDEEGKIEIVVTNCTDTSGVAAMNRSTSGDHSADNKGKFEVEEQMCSLLSAQRLEVLLPETLPRIYVANRSDLLHTQGVSVPRSVVWGRVGVNSGIPLGDSEIVRKSLKPALDHLRKHELPPLLFASTVTGEGIEELKSAIRRVSAHPTLGIPVAYRNRGSDSKLTGVGTILFAVVTVALIASAIVFGRESSAGTIKEGLREGEAAPSPCMSWIRRAMMSVLGTTSQRE